MILFPKARRRHPGFYVYRTQRHLARGTEWGYAGKSNHLARRKIQHETKEWADLVVWYKAFELPWWLGWQWVTLSLETLVIFALRPRYNWQKNPRLSKVGPIGQKAQRAERDRRRLAGTYIERRYDATFLIRFTAIAMILIGITGWAFTR
jgi:hypothetical protein